MHRTVRRRGSLLAAAGALALATGPEARAADPISMQGRLVGPGGAALVGAVDLRVSVYDVAQDGVALHFEDFAVLVGPGGVYDSTLSLPEAIVDGRPLWVGLRVDGEAEELQPRVALRPVAYAHHADRLDGKEGADFLDVTTGAQEKRGGLRVATHSGQVGIGAAAPTRLLDVDGDARVRGALQVGDNAACDGTRAGSIRFDGANFLGCNGSGWVRLDLAGGGGGAVPGDGSSAGTAGQTCLSILAGGHATGSGLYWIQPGGLPPRQVYCDMVTEGGGWTLLGKTVQGGLTAGERTTIRNSGWATYTQDGYGDPAPGSRLFWLPLDYWNALTTAHPHNHFSSRTSQPEVRAEDLSVAGPADDYRWTWRQTPAGYADIIFEIKGQKFTTHDDDNDLSGSQNCASNNVGLNGGFWYRDCYQLSMLHADGNVKWLGSNASHNVSFNELYFRETPLSTAPGDGRTPLTAGASCRDILTQHPTSASGVYWIDPAGTGAHKVHCDMQTEGGGWTLLAETVGASLSTLDQDTIRRSGWQVYTQDGYGDPDPNVALFWLPLRLWNALTTRYPSNQLSSRTTLSEIRVDNLTVADASDEYRWDWAQTTPGFSAILVNNKGMRFTTHDRDNDTVPSYNCSYQNHGWGGGWWYNNCYQLSMLHPDDNVKWLGNNASSNVAYNRIYFRER